MLKTLLDPHHLTVEFQDELVYYHANRNTVLRLNLLEQKLNKSSSEGLSFFWASIICSLPLLPSHEFVEPEIFSVRFLPLFLVLFSCSSSRTRWASRSLGFFCFPFTFSLGFLFFFPPFSLSYSRILAASLRDK